MTTVSETAGKTAMWRARQAGLAMLAASASLFAPGAFAAKAPPKPAPVVERADRVAGEPIMAIVSIKSQKVTFYDADGWIMRAPVSTGTTGRETPAGVFAVIEKDKDHHSSMYDDAWMPNMQRITWNGLALHGGPLPGYAASHGCVRMPYGFAEEMFDKTRIGMRVIVSPIDAEPVDFSSPALFQPNPEAIAAVPEQAQAATTAATEAAATADGAKAAAKTAARDSTAAAALVRKLTALKSRADAQLVAAGKALAAADQAKAKADDRRQKAAAAAADFATQLDAANAANPPVAAAPAADTTGAIRGDANAGDPAKPATAIAASAPATLDPAALRKLQAQKTRADTQLAAADKALAAAGEADTRAHDAEAAATAKAADLATQLEAAKTDATAKAAAATAAKDAIKPAQTEKVAAAKAATEAQLLAEPVSIYISRATQKLYVRRNTHKPAPDGGGEVFDTSIEEPVTIRDPGKPLGTHIFTAMAATDTGLRWTAVSIDNGDTAADALDRVTIPQDVLDRIAPTALPRSSIIISDEPLSAETNYRTEFVAVLSDYPQGGFITRQPSSEELVSGDSRDDDESFDFFSLFGGNSHRSRDRW
jgi:hypothetical protein